MVSASSINALGNGFGVRPIPVHYFPIDEAHPGSTSDVYSFSKQVLEEIAAYFWRRESVSGACLRFPWVFDHRWFQSERVNEFRTRFEAVYAELMALPEDVRQIRVQETLAKMRDLREQHERGELADEAMFAAMREIPVAMLTFGAKDFWAMLDARDAAQAIEKAIVADYASSHPLWIVDSHNSTGLPSRELASLLYPDVKTWKRPVEGTEALISIDKARELIGFEPEHSVSQWLEVE